MYLQMDIRNHNKITYNTTFYSVCPPLAGHGFLKFLKTWNMHCKSWRMVLQLSKIRDKEGNIYGHDF